MRREYKQGQSYVDWLKSLGCVMYLPLSEGDLQDKISGEYLQLTGDGSIVWDSAEQMYKVTQPSSYNQHIARLDNGITNLDFPNDNYTTIHSIKKITSSNSKNINSMSPSTLDRTTSQSLGAMYNGTAVTGRWPTRLANVAYVTNNDQRNRSLYQNGALYGTYAEHLPYLPSNWIMNGSGIIFGFTSNDDNIFLDTQYYMKEVYLFSTALDLQTIRKIQGYDTTN